MEHPTLRLVDFSESLAERLADPSAQPVLGEIVLYWLGQAGFVIDFAGRRILIDPYLSDSLAKKYKGTKYEHRRMMASPIAPEQFTRLDLVLCTHRHTDHMDPDTLPLLAAAFPKLQFVVPAASIDEASRRCGVGADRLVPANAGEQIQPLPGLLVYPVASAHESIQMDDMGRHEWLGYVMDVAGLRLYHSGDCAPYPGLTDVLAHLKPHLALLPVNGRDANLSTNGVPGNFTLDEAVSLCHDARVPAMLAHHFGLFKFNTVSPSVIDARSQHEKGGNLNLIRASLGKALYIGATQGVIK